MTCGDIFNATSDLDWVVFVYRTAIPQIALTIQPNCKYRAVNLQKYRVRPTSCYSLDSCNCSNLHRIYPAGICAITELTHITAPYCIHSAFICQENAVVVPCSHGLD